MILVYNIINTVLFYDIILNYATKTSVKIMILANNMIVIDNIALAYDM